LVLFIYTLDIPQTGNIKVITQTIHIAAFICEKWLSKHIPVETNTPITIDLLLEMGGGFLCGPCQDVMSKFEMWEYSKKGKAIPVTGH
jgi:hypothetical protein